MSRMERKHAGKDKIYPVYVAILAIIIAVIWIFVFIKVNQYEKGSTRYLINQVVTNLESQYGGEMTYKRAKSVDEGILYNIYQNDEMFATTVLKERPDQGMLGFSLYDIGEIKGVKNLCVYALEGDNVSIGGKKISDVKVSGEGICLPALEALANHKTNNTCKVPHYNLYVSENSFDTPKIEGDNLVFIKIDKGTLVAHEMSAALQNELKEWTRDFFERYTHYVVFGKEFDNISDDIFYTSPIYNTVSKFRYLWDYYYDYELEMKEFKYSDFIQYTDDIVSVRVQYHYVQTLNRSKLDNHPDMNVFLFKNDGRWQIIEMEISEWTE